MFGRNNKKKTVGGIREERYRVNSIHSVDDGLSWFYKTFFILQKIHKVYVNDPKRNYIDASDYKILDNQVSLAKLQHVFKTYDNAKAINVEGEFAGTPVIVGYDFNSYEFFVQCDSERVISRIEERFEV